MNERKMQFRVGLLVLVASVVAAVMLIRFGERPALRSGYTIDLHFDYAPNVQIETPVRKSGIRIGRVSNVRLNDDPHLPAVTVEVEIERQYRLRKDSRPTITRTLLGDASIEFIPGRAGQFLEAGDVVEGDVPPDVLAMAEKLEDKIVGTLDSWESVGSRLDILLARHEDDVNEALTQLARSLRSFNDAMVGINAVFGDPQHRRNVQRTLEAMPGLIVDAREAVRAVRGATGRADANLQNLERMTGAMADHTGAFVEKLDDGATKANQLLDELNLLATRFNQKDGTWSQLTTNPDLYRNLNQAAFNLNQLLIRLEAVVENAEVFSDVIARHPEKLGIGGVLNPSPGTKPPTSPPRTRGRVTNLQEPTNDSRRR